MSQNNESRSAIQNRDTRGSPARQNQFTTANAKRKDIANPLSKNLRADEFDEGRSQKQCKSQNSIIDRVDEFLVAANFQTRQTEQKFTKFDYSKGLLKVPNGELFDALFTFLMNILEGNSKRYDSGGGKISRIVKMMGFLETNEKPTPLMTNPRVLNPTENWNEALRVLDFLIDRIEENQKWKSAVVQPMPQLETLPFEKIIEVFWVHNTDKLPEDGEQIIKESMGLTCEKMDKEIEELSQAVDRLKDQNREKFSNIIDNQHLTSIIQSLTERNAALDERQLQIQNLSETEHAANVALIDSCQKLNEEINNFGAESKKITDQLVAQKMTHEERSKIIAEIADYKQQEEELRRKIDELQIENEQVIEKLKELTLSIQTKLEHFVRSGIYGMFETHPLSDRLCNLKQLDEQAVAELDDFELKLEAQVNTLVDQVNEFGKKRAWLENNAHNLETQTIEAESLIQDLEESLSKIKSEIVLLQEEQREMMKRHSVQTDDLDASHKDIKHRINKLDSKLKTAVEMQQKARADLEFMIEESRKARVAFEQGKKDQLAAISEFKEKLVSILKMRIHLDNDYLKSTRKVCAETRSQPAANTK